MITYTLVAILGALLAVVLMQLFKKQKPAQVAARPAPDLAGLKVTDARVGDTLSLAGAGDEMADLDFTADRRADWQAGQRRWSELSGPYRERRVYLRVAEAEEVEVRAALDGQRYTLADLGLSEEDMAAMDERQNTADSFEFDGKPWFYRWSREVTGPAGAFYGWEFQEESGKESILIRKAEGEPFTAAIYRRIHPADVTVYRGT